MTRKQLKIERRKLIDKVRQQRAVNFTKSETFKQKLRAGIVVPHRVQVQIAKNHPTIKAYKIEIDKYIENVVAEKLKAAQHNV